MSPSKSAMKENCIISTFKFVFKYEFLFVRMKTHLNLFSENINEFSLSLTLFISEACYV